ncbi:hypothetical protein LEP1GSC050_2790 [Leptospira broomii serovar Hurstbridge str. 5399]|uniref:Uncharacterized protein n=1 Tax=Leptospira broomii serovar Hurstbridge str. 5399 TaxID=1049789 RepID=T0EYX9_9LEPT|nr:hypothetical protein LEP1GSC050_2790 [Leptospira broomii serovar Hurstbridge str. 5399]
MWIGKKPIENSKRRVKEMSKKIIRIYPEISYLNSPDIK